MCLSTFLVAFCIVFFFLVTREFYISMNGSTPEYRIIDESGQRTGQIACGSGLSVHVREHVVEMQCPNQTPIFESWSPDFDDLGVQIIGESNQKIPLAELWFYDQIGTSNRPIKRLVVHNIEDGFGVGRPGNGELWEIPTEVCIFPTINTRYPVCEVSVQVFFDLFSMCPWLSGSLIIQSI